MNLRLKTAGLAVLAAATPLLAEVKVSENFFLSGYVVGAVTNTENDGADDWDTAFDSGSSNLDAAKLLAKGVVGPVTGVVSGFYVPELAGDDEVGVLDAYATYTSGPFSLTGGKFLSWLGYEAFDPINMTQLTYGPTIFAVPGYHTGVKFDVATETYSFGAAALDSVMPGSGFFQGDGEIDDDIGFEAYFTWKGTDNLTLFVGGALEDTDGGDNLSILDIWASYKISDALTIAGEFDVWEDVGWAWMGFVQYNISSQFYVIGRVGSIDYDGGGDAFKYTAAATFVINEYLSIRGEISQTEDPWFDPTFYGLQAVLKF